MTADRSRFLAGLLAWFRPAAGTRHSDPPSLPLLEYMREPQAADWLRASMTTFAESVASFLPGHFEAYARIYHPFELNDGTTRKALSWRDVAAEEGADPRDPATAEAFRDAVSGRMQARVGTLPPALIDPLVEHLRHGTTTPERCFFAVWEGFAHSAVSHSLEPRLELPNRRYHVFAGPIEGARTNLSVIDFDHLSANLWWPADQAWCVATEIDFAWTYVGGPRSCIRVLLADPRLEAAETTASAPW